MSQVTGQRYGSRKAAHPSTEESAAPWFGEVPERWHVLPNRAIFTEVNERGHPQADMLSVTIIRGVIRQQALLEDSAKKDGSNLDRAAYKHVQSGDIVYNKMRAWQGAVGVSNLEGIVSPAYVVLRPRNMASSHYMHYLLRTPAFAKEAERWSYGITSDMWSLRPEHFKLIYSCLPSLPEQAAIVHFLDHADRRIQRAIRAKQKLIKLLEEQKQALIHRAVTGQIDVRTGQPYPAYKPSGVAWLGEVPEHWEVMRLKDATTVQTGLTLGKDYRSAATRQYPYLRVANVQAGRLDLRVVKNIDVPDSEAHRCMLRNHDVLMTEGGDIDKLGRGCVWTGQIAECLHQNHVFAVRCGPKLVPDFLVGLMATGHGRSYFQITAKQTTNLAATNSSTLRAFPIVVPGVEEQNTILSQITAEIRVVDGPIRAAKNEIALLREYRTRLIADVVTGKLDVRDAAARLPEDADEPEPLGDTAAIGDIEDEGVDDGEVASVEIDA